MHVSVQNNRSRFVFFFFVFVDKGADWDGAVDQMRRSGGGAFCWLFANQSACHLHQLLGRLVCNHSEHRGGPLGMFSTFQGPSGVGGAHSLFGMQLSELLSAPLRFL